MDFQNTQRVKQSLFWSAYFAGFHDQVVDSTGLWFDALTKETADAIIVPAKALGAEHRKVVTQAVKELG